MRKVPTWVRPLLLGGGVINLLLALVFVLMPEGSRALFFGNALFLQPQSLQIYGILLATLGVGYLTVSVNPFTNKVVLLMGLVANLLFAILLMVVANGAFWQSVALQLWVLIALGWCAAMIAVLYQLAKARQSPQALAQSYQEPLSKTLSRFRTQRGKSLLQLSNERPTMVVFLRRFGSISCREMLTDINQQRRSIEQRGTQIVLVHMADTHEASDVFEKYELGGLHHVSDPSGIMYNAFGLKKSNFKRLFGWSFRFVSTIQRMLSPSGEQPKGMRMPGVFLISKGEIVRSYRHSNEAQRPNFRQLSSDQAA